MNCPESLLSFTSAYACTIFGWPQTNPSRQPIMLKPFDIECTSTPTSLAPSTCRKLSGSAPVAQQDVGRVLHDDDLVLVGEVDDAPVEVGAWRRPRSGCSDS